MFGYITPNIPEMKVKDYQTYRSFYCGLCKSLKKDYGRRGQATLSYDLTFFAVLLTGLYEPDTEHSCERCFLHPFTKNPHRKNQFSAYAADMNIILSYYKLVDDWQDERKLFRHISSLFLKGKYKKAIARHPEKAAAVADALADISKAEKQDESNIDYASGCFGKAFSELFVYRADEWADTLRQVGFYFGKFIYLMDAYEDLEKDLETGNYNPFKHMKDSTSYEEDCKQILTMMISECAKAFEKLPIIEYIDILRNILYSGVWSRYEMMQQKGKEQTNGNRSL